MKTTIELLEELLKTNQDLNLQLAKNLALQKLVNELQDEIKELKSKNTIVEHEKFVSNFITKLHKDNV